jgi:Hint domain-containing protein
MKKWIAFISLVVFLTACAPIIPGSGSGVSTPIVMTAQVSTIVVEAVGTPATAGPFPTLAPPTPVPTLSVGALSPTELKYKILEQFPDFFFCDPDFYPIAREEEPVLVQQRFPALQANQEEFQAILNHNGLAGATTFTDDQKLLMYREHKKLNAIHFEAVEDKYQFQIQTGAEGQQGSVITGTIDGSGSIDLQKQEPAIPTCPICLAKGTLIDTPRGPIPVENLRIGDPVWTMDGAGERVAATILRTSHIPVPATHHVVHVTLSDGRELWASPGHPTIDGKSLGDLAVNDLLDGGRVINVERLGYTETATYDLLPSGDTGYYWANGILIGSTLAE